MRYKDFEQEHISGGIRLYQADCMKMLSQIPDKYYSLCICDPPYGIGWDGENATMSAGVRKNGTQRKMESWNNPRPKGYMKKEWDNKSPDKIYFDELKRVTRNQIIWGGNYFTEYLVPSGGWVTWEKGVPDGMSLSQCELAWTNCLNSIRHIRLLWAGYKKCEEVNRTHPTQKPIKLYEWLLKNYAKPGDRILDTHLGSGSIAIACYNMGFDLDGYEIDKDYYEAAVKRLEDHKRQGLLFTPRETCG